MILLFLTDLLLEVTAFKPVVRCLMLHNFEGFLQKFKLNISGFVQYLSVFFLEAAL